MSDVPPEERHAALAVVSRRRLIDALHAAGEPTDAATLAKAIGLHLTTTRFHLEVLEKAGFVERAVERGGRPGRPRQLYRLIDRPDVGDQGADERYRELAGLLAEAIAGEPNAAQQRAEDAGRRWAKSQVPLGNLTWDEGTREVVTVFDRLGFAPRLVDDELGRRVELAACPFRDLARQYPEVICVVHAGLLRGLLSRLGIPHSDRADMRPFVREDLCIAEFPGSDGSVLGTG